VRVALRGARVTRRFFGRAMVMVAGSARVSRSPAPPHDDERCRESELRCIFDGLPPKKGKAAKPPAPPAKGAPSRVLPEPLAKPLIRGVPSQGPVTGRARMNGNGFVLACSVDDRSEGAPSGHCRPPLPDRAANHERCLERTLSVQQAKRVIRGLPAFALRVSFVDR